MLSIRKYLKTFQRLLPRLQENWELQEFNLPANYYERNRRKRINK